MESMGFMGSMARDRVLEDWAHERKLNGYDSANESLQETVNTLVNTLSPEEQLEILQEHGNMPANPHAPGPFEGVVLTRVGWPVLRERLACVALSAAVAEVLPERESPCR